MDKKISKTSERICSRQGLVWIVLAMMAGGCAQPAEPEQTIDEWIHLRVRIINAGDKAAYLETVHPAVRKAVNDQNRFFFDKVFDGDLDTRIPDDYTIDETQEISPDAPLTIRPGMTFPVRPTHQIGISYQVKLYSYRGIVWHVVQDRGRWYQLMAVPDADGLKALKEARDKGVGLWKEN